MTLTEAIDLYIQNSDAVLSPTTVHGYKEIQKNSFEQIMNIPLKKLTKPLLQEAVNTEAKKIAFRSKKPLAPKTVKNRYGLITAVLNQYYKELDCSVRLPAATGNIKELLPPEIIIDLVKDTVIELPVLLAMWLSFSMSEIKGLKWDSIRDGYIQINQVVVTVDNEEVEKEQAKTTPRKRIHKIPDYIMDLLNKVPHESEYIISMSGHAIYNRFKRLLMKNNLPHMTFHDLRHVNASVMALLRIPDKYAQERGGWKSDKVMKKVYTHTFSDERKAVDQIIDDYFIQKMQHEMQHGKEKTP